MIPIVVVISFLSWQPDKQIKSLPGLPEYSGSPNFCFDLDNPVVKIAKIVEDLHFPREGETAKMWRERQRADISLTKEVERRFDEIFEGIDVVFDLMRHSSKESLFTAHGIEKAAPWRLVRTLANEAKQCLPNYGDPSEQDVVECLRTYKFDS